MIDEAPAPVDDEGDEANGRGPGRPNVILETMRELGPCSAQEIAQRIGRETGNVSTRLRQMEQQANQRVRRTGRSVNPGGRGGPQVEWDLAREGDTPTSPTDPGTLPPSSIEVERERVRALTEKIRTLSEEVERLEVALETSEELRKEAETRTAAATSQGGGYGDLLGAEHARPLLRAAARPRRPGQRRRAHLRPDRTSHRRTVT